MHIDMDEFRAVAKVVIKFNKHVGKDVDLLVNQMVAHACSFLTPGYFATGGYMLTAYNHPTGELGVKPSISHIIF